MDRRPKNTDQSDWQRLPDEVRDLLRGMEWVAKAEVRLREEGHIFMGEALVVPRPGACDLVRKLGRAADAAKALDWRMHELAVMLAERPPAPAPR